MKHKRTKKQMTKLFNLLVLVGLVVALTPAARAADQVVTNTDDSGAGSLRQAIADVGAGETITFDLTYPATIVLTSGELVIDKNLTITGPGAGQLTISGNDASRVFNVSSGTATISGVTIRDGYVPGSSAEGGGIYVASGAALTLQEVMVTDNIAQGSECDELTPQGGFAQGGGIHNDGTLTVSASTISGNTAQGGECMLDDSCMGGGAGGGGIYSVGTLTVSASTISGNTAQGGAAYCGGGSGGGEGEGGGLFSGIAGTLVMTASTISGNTAQGSYGEVVCGPGRGGGFGSNEFSGSSELTNVTISGNTAWSCTSLILGLGTGGGASATLNAKFSFCTIAGNEAFTEGGGIYGGSTGQGPNVKNTIIADNTAPANSDFANYLQSYGYNLIEDGPFANIQGDTTGNLTGVDPDLGALADNGGPTQTHAPNAGSPAIDAGSSTDVDGDTVNADQRGATRPTDGDGDSTVLHDMGAYELGSIQCRIQEAGEPATYTFLKDTEFYVIDDGTDLDCLRVTDIPYNHPHATQGYLRTLKYWIIQALQTDKTTAATTDYDIALTLPFTGADADDRLCRWTGSTWDCGTADDHTIGTDELTRENISALSDWTVGDDVPTSTNQAPVADAGADQTVETNATVTLDGSGSYDPDGHTPLTYGWAQSGGPAVTLSDSTAVSPTFSAPSDPAVLTFTLGVTDSLGMPDPTPDEVVVTVANQAPVANAGADQTVDTNATVTLDGSGSYDPDGHTPLTYGWTQSGGPAVTLSDSTAVSPTFTAPGATTLLTFTLTVTDALGLASTPDTVVITVSGETYYIYLPLVLRDS